MKKVLVVLVLVAVSVLAIPLLTVLYTATVKENVKQLAVPEEFVADVESTRVLASGLQTNFIPYLKDPQEGFGLTWDDTYSPFFDPAYLQVSVWDNGASSTAKVSVLDEAGYRLDNYAVVTLWAHPIVALPVTSRVEDGYATFEIPLVIESQVVFVTINNENGTLVYRGIVTAWLQDQKPSCVLDQWWDEAEVIDLDCN